MERKLNKTMLSKVRSHQGDLEIFLENGALWLAAEAGGLDDPVLCGEKVDCEPCDCIIGEGLYYNRQYALLEVMDWKARTLGEEVIRHAVTDCGVGKIVVGPFVMAILTEGYVDVFIPLKESVPGEKHKQSGVIMMNAFS